MTSSRPIAGLHDRRLARFFGSFVLDDFHLGAFRVRLQKLHHHLPSWRRVIGGEVEGCPLPIVPRLQQAGPVRGKLVEGPHHGFVALTGGEVEGCERYAFAISREEPSTRFGNLGKTFKIFEIC